MAETCFPLENTLYTAEDAQLWLATRTSGVYAGTHLGVTANDTMEMTLGSGIAWLHYDEFAGCVYGNRSALALAVDMSDGQYNRIDRVCIRLEMLNNKCYAYIKKGTADANPVPPELQRDNVAFEISVAQIFVGAGVIGISPGNITDERLDETVCGLMRDGVTGIDTSVMQAQFASMLDTFTTVYQAEFEQWFAQVQDTLSDDVAGNLLNLIVGKTSTGSRSVVIPAAGWSAESPYTQNIMVDGVTARSSCHVILSYDPIYKAEYEACGVHITEQHSGYLTFEVESIPESDFPVNLLVVNPSSGADEPATSANTALLEAIEATAIQLEASGSEITLSDSADAPLMAVTMYGKTTQDGTPEPANPVDLVSVGDYGFVRIDSASDDLTRSAVIQMSNALRGMKGTQGTNYTDASGAQLVTDELKVNADGTGEIVRRIACNVYDGTENWSKLGSNNVGNVFSCTPKIPLYHISSPRMTSHFVQSDNSSAYSPAGTSNGYMRFAGGVNNMLFFIRNDLVASVDEWKSFLAAQAAAGTPLMDVYGCEAQTQTLTAEEVRSFLLLRTHKLNTVITNTDGADMAIRYVADTKTYIDNKFAELSTAMIGG